MAAYTYVPRGDVLIVTDSSRALLGARLRGYDGRPLSCALAPSTPIS